MILRTTSVRTRWSCLPLLFLILTFHPGKVAAEEWISVPANRPVVAQRPAGPNTCGPACLLDAYQSATPRWQRSLQPYDALKTEKARVQRVIQRHGLRPSLQWRNQIRWNHRGGIVLHDLGKMANEMRRGFSLEKLEAETLFRRNQESDHELLKRVHSKFRKSLQHGFPPIISLRRVADRRLPNSGTRMWITVQGHFVVLTGLPKTLTPGAASFPVTYHDTWTARSLRGKIDIPSQTFFAAPVNDHSGKVYRNPTLIANFPSTRVGLNKVRRGEKSSLTLAGAVGAF